MKRLNELIEQLNEALAGRYQIQGELGSGGMGVVLLAEDLRHGRSVALKIVRPELTGSLGVERFLREIGTTAGLQHPNILPLFDSGEVRGTLYYVMPYVQGESLRHRLRRERQLPIDDAVKIASDIAEALSYAHARDVVHRDIKPENILLTGSRAIVADFGLASAISAAGGTGITETGISVGTPQYMAPEQITGDAVDGRADLYALGCIVYEMLAGESPHAGHSTQVVIAKRLADPVPSVRRLREAVSEGVDQALIRALAKIPADRFASAAAFAEALTKPTLVQPSPRSVAVLPFVNMSTDPENEYFADGITEDVIVQLSKIRTIKVTSRTSVMQFKGQVHNPREIRTKLGIATLLEGSVRRAGNRVRIVAQLIDTDTDAHLWAETYDRDLTDIFAIQSDVALQIAAALKAELSAGERSRIVKEPTKDLEAYQFYLKGRSCLSKFTESGIQEGLEHLEKALELDPTFALAYADVAFGYIVLGLGHGAGTLQPRLAYDRAREAVGKAVALDSGLGQAHTWCGFLKCLCDFEWVGAEQEFKRAIELSPGAPEVYRVYGLILGALERFDEAIAMHRRAAELDPLGPVSSSDLASALLRAGQHDKALRIAKHLIEIEPHFPMGYSTLGWAYIKENLFDKGLTALEKAVSLSPGNTLFLAQLGQAYALTGKPARATEVLNELNQLSQQRYVSPYHLAYIHAGLGEQDKAIDLLELAYEERSGGIYGIKGSFLFTTLQPHPRFMTLLKRMNLE